MRKIIILFLFFAGTISWAKGDNILAPSFVPQAIVAKQIAPGPTRAFTIGGIYTNCDIKTETKSNIKYCDTPNSMTIKDEIGGTNYRFDVNLLSFLWPKTENKEGAENWYGHFFGGGLFLNAHYSTILEAGISPMLTQWIGPFYIGATYAITFGHYFDENEEKTENKIAGSLNLGGGFMGFMNNHGIGFGLHGGTRQLQIIHADYHIKEWIIYYGLDILSYSNLPLLNESNSKGHFGFLTSMEVGVHTDNNPLMYWAFSFSLML